MKTDLVLKFKQNLFSKVIWSSTFKSAAGKVCNMQVASLLLVAQLVSTLPAVLIIVLTQTGPVHEYFRRRIDTKFPSMGIVTDQ